MNEALLISAIWIPLAGFIINGLLSLKKGPAPKVLVNLAGVGSALVSFLIFAYLTFQTESFGSDAALRAVFFNWLNLDSLTLDFAYRLDGLSVFMAWIVTGIGSLIHIYSTGYMAEEKDDYARFFAYLNLFIFSMLHLVMGDNMALLFLGWEGVGLCSYLLIGFDHHKNFAAAAGKKAFITNRIGDAGFLIGMFMIFSLTGSFQYDDINSALVPGSVPASMLNIIAVFLFIGAMGKSAQIPLYVWLPDAMAGPTPVSALIHAATMVTAGVFMIARLSVVFLGAPEASTFIAFTGATTAIVAALIALTQTDIKKVLAYSTVSQLGYMFMAMGVGAYGAGLFHLMTHAFFKALLFLGSGAVIIALHHEQDMRKMGGLFKHLKLIAVVFWVGAIAISGIPGLSGFFSKDMILEHAYMHANGGKILWGMGFVTALLTSFYIYRLIFLTFHTREDATEKVHPHHGEGHDASHGFFHHVGWNMKGPLVVLAVLSVIGGYVGLPHLFTHTDPAIMKYFDRVLAIAPSAVEESWKVKASYAEQWLLMGLSVAVALGGLVLAYILYQKKNRIPIPDGAYRTMLVSASYRKFLVDEAYAAVLLRPLKKLADFSYRKIDAGFIDGIIDGFGEAGLRFGSLFSRLQSGNTGQYALFMAVGAVMALVIILGGLA